MWQLIITLIIVGLCIWLVVRNMAQSARKVQRGEGCGCGSGCQGCSASKIETCREEGPEGCDQAQTKPE